MITGVILTKNEENNIIDCVESLQFCDEIIVVDDNSSDRTQELLKVLGNKYPKLTVYKRELNNNFSNQRNFALSKAKHEWVFFVDADERVRSNLKSEILNGIKNNNIAGYLIKREDYIWNKKLKYGETGNIYLLRLARRDKGAWQGSVHEVWKVRGKTAKLTSTLQHFPHQSLSQFLKEINFYTDLRAQELYEQRKKVNALSIIFYPKAKFFVNFIIKRGFKDGLPGLVFAILMSFHSFLVRAKLWMLWKK